MAASPITQSSSYNLGVNQASSTGANLSQTYIPEYSQTPILEGIAKYAQGMAPQVYQWGMDQYNKNQGNIDSMMRSALSYASPQRIAASMGMAESGVQQGAEAGRQNALRDLQSYGIDPSSGRYAALDTANRVMSGAAAAGAGNQQRMADQAAGTAMQNQALSSSMQNTQLGYGASNAANDWAKTGMSLPYSPLGTTSSGINTSQSSGYNIGGTQSSSTPLTRLEQWGNQGGGGTAPIHEVALAEGGEVPDEVSPTNGNVVDDVKANLTSGEFIIPKDIVEWKGQEFFYKLMAATRKMRATNGDENKPAKGAATGYAGGGDVGDDDGSFTMEPSQPQDLGMMAKTGRNNPGWAHEYSRRLKNPGKYYAENLLQPNGDGTYSRHGDTDAHREIAGRPSWVDQDKNWVDDPNNPGGHAQTRPELAEERRAAKEAS